ncbi:MAG: response regulator [Deltaproteobacteria bacterium]|nr:response regulator [Deltaproteobacteria bacterium]
MLTALGYRVLTAGTPEEAMRQSEAHPGDIHLLLTDVVMPGMNGRDLADRLCQTRPEMKCLYMSGYTADIIARQGVLEKGVQFIQKPFTLDQLARKVKEAMGNEG